MDLFLRTGLASAWELDWHLGRARALGAPPPRACHLQVLFRRRPTVTRAPCLVMLVAAISTACHPGPVIDVGAKQPPVGGTIAGIVTTVDSDVGVVGRVVTATET